MGSTKPVTVHDFHNARSKGQKLAVLTAYDYSMAKILDNAGVDAILVGDSLGMVVQGHSTSLPVTLDEMIYHTKCVVRGVKRAMVITDLPFMTYQLGPKQALETAGRVLKESGANAVKLEGGVRSKELIAAIAEADIPVMGHIGLTPQSVQGFGGFRVQRDAAKLLADAKAVQEAGAFAMVVECVPREIVQELQAATTIPLIGIGAGPDCDGQVLVIQDMLGLFQDFVPKFVKQYTVLHEAITTAVQNYCSEVRTGAFPTDQYSFHNTK